MSEYAPPAIRRLFDTVAAAIPGAQLAGIIGDQAHTYGYHRGRAWVDVTDYSVQLWADQQGSPEAACGLDLTWAGAADQYAVSARLLAAAGDPRMLAAREFYGSIDGWTVCGWDYPGGYPVTSDPSHLWHVHLSILRQYADDDAACQAIASVITGLPAGPSPTDSPEVPEMIVGQDQSTGRIYLISGNTKLEFPTGGAVPSGDMHSPGNTGHVYADEILAMIAYAYPGSNPKFAALNPDIVARIPDVWTTVEIVPAGAGSRAADVTD